MNGEVVNNFNTIEFSQKNYLEPCMHKRKLIFYYTAKLEFSNPRSTENGKNAYLCS